LLGSFLHGLANLDPWWVSIVSPVNGDHKITLADLLGFEHEVALDFLCSAGLLKIGPIKYLFSSVQRVGAVYCPIVQERLQGIMEMVNRSSISHSKYFFIHYGKKEKLSHRPIDKFNGNRSWLKKNIFITAWQKKFHQKVSDMLLS